MTNIHPTAIISSKNVIIEEGVEVGPYCVIGDNVTLKQGVKLISHVVIQKNTTIDENSTLFPFAVVGFVPQDLKFEGEETQVYIGKNTTIREHTSIHLATKHSKDLTTKIGDSCLIMGCVHVAHDCNIGNNVILANNTMVAGHVTVGNNVVVGGGVAIHQFCRIGDFCMIGGVSTVLEDVVPYAMLTGIRNNSFINGINVFGLKRHNFTVEQVVNIRKAYDTLFIKSDKSFEERFKDLTQKNNPQEVQKIIDFINNPDKKRNLHVRYKEDK